MGKTVRIEVTAEDIAKGIIGDSCYCPIALACCRAGFPKVAIGRNHFFPDRHRGDHTLLPLDAREFTVAFDGRRAVKPFSFNLRLP